MQSIISFKYGATNRRNIAGEMSGPVWLPKSLIKR
jgi:hypothetical protein